MLENSFIEVKTISIACPGCGKQEIFKLFLKDGDSSLVHQGIETYLRREKWVSYLDPHTRQITLCCSDKCRGKFLTRRHMGAMYDWNTGELEGALEVLEEKLEAQLK